MNDRVRVPYTERQHHLLRDRILADAERSGEHPALVAERRLAGLVSSPALSDRILRDIQILRDLLRDHR